MTEYINYGHRYHLKIYLYEKYGRTAIIFVNNFRFSILSCIKGIIFGG